jgi:hypothetical protein
VRPLAAAAHMPLQSGGAAAGGWHGFPFQHGLV